MKQYPPLKTTATTINNEQPPAMTGEIVATKLGAYLIVDGGHPPVSIDKLDADFISSSNLSIKCKTDTAAQFYCELFNRKSLTLEGKK